MPQQPNKPGHKSWVLTGQGGGYFVDKSGFQNPVDNPPFYKQLIKNYSAPYQLYIQYLLRPSKPDSKGLLST